MKKQKKRVSFFAEKPNQEGYGLMPGYTGEFEAVKTDTLPAAIKGCSRKINLTKNKADSY